MPVATVSNGVKPSRFVARSGAAKASTQPSSGQQARLVARLGAAGASKQPSPGQQARQASVGRREPLLAIAALVALTWTGKAEAFLGLGEDNDKKYNDRTNADKEAEVKTLKKEMNDWTASYRTDRVYGGRPSFSNMYSAVNALAGHWNSFGADAPVPKKRLDRIQKELDDAGKFLSRNR